MVYSADRSTQKDTSSSAVTSSLSLRPKFSPIIARLAASSVVDRLIRDGHLEEDTREDSLEDIAKYARPHMDGYEIAKALDDYASWCISALLVGMRRNDPPAGHDRQPAAVLG